MFGFSDRDERDERDDWVVYGRHLQKGQVVLVPVHGGFAPANTSKLSLYREMTKPSKLSLYREIKLITELYLEQSRLRYLPLAISRLADVDLL